MIYILIPAYNEENNIVPLLKGIEKAMGDAELPYRLLVVNDGSTDRTGEILEEHGKTMPLEVIHHPENRNLGGAMKTGYKRLLEIGGEDDLVITLDADNSHPPRDLLRIYDHLLDGPDVIVASRYQKGGEEKGVPGHRIFLSKGANFLFKLLFPIEGISDYTGSFRGMRVKAIRRAWGEKGADVLEEQGFTVMPEILLHLRKKGLTFSEIPLVLRYDLKTDESKMKLMANVRGTLGLMARMFMRGLRGGKG